jgi:hypothetical protein
MSINKLPIAKLLFSGTLCVCVLVLVRSHNPNHARHTQYGNMPPCLAPNPTALAHTHPTCLHCTPHAGVALVG